MSDEKNFDHDNLDKVFNDQDTFQNAGFHFPFPFFFSVSGLYKRTSISYGVPASFPVKPPAQGGHLMDVSEADELDSIEQKMLFPWLKIKEDLRLDVDGRYPQNTVSGTIKLGLSKRLHWIAKLKKSANNTWKGSIWYKKGNNSLLPHTKVIVVASPSFWYNQKKVTVLFYGGGGPIITVTYSYVSYYFHSVNFEFDVQQNETAITSIDTGAHPNRPAGLPQEQLTIQTVFRRTGFRVSTNSPGAPVPLSGAGANAKWSDMEMHDAMQTYWSKFDNKAQWAMWVFFASQHEDGFGLGGVMFDSIGPNHRQGTAIFNNSFIKNAPAGDTHPAAWVERMKFWTAVHEMGHGFNLAHSWQKTLGNPWINLSDEPEARSFMNYPFRVSGGQSAFFADFEYRFSNDELLFLRHAPTEMVEMGNNDWFDDHGFQQAAVNQESKFKLELRIHRTMQYFEFLEPVTIEVKLENVSNEPTIVPTHLIDDLHDLMIMTKRHGGKAKKWHPMAHKCYTSEATVLQPGKAIYAQVSVAYGAHGWIIDEPGKYAIQAVLSYGGEDVVSNSLIIQVAPPKNFDHELIGQDFYSEDVARTLAFNGSMYFDGANDVLKTIATDKKFEGSRSAIHASIALANPLSKNYKRLIIPEKTEEMSSAAKAGGKISKARKDVDEAKHYFEESLVNESERAADTLGHIEYHHVMDNFNDFLSDEGDKKTASANYDVLHDTLKSRKVLDSVLRKIKTKSKNLDTAAKRQAKGK